MDQFDDIKILKKVMLPYAEEEEPLEWVFQQDNDHKHTSKPVAYRFQTNKINVMECPAQSPDRNPIENLWGDIKNPVSEAKPQCKKCSAIVLGWKTCSQLPDSCNADVKQFSETMAIQLNISSVIHKKAKS